MEWDEPIPSFGTRFPILWKGLATPFRNMKRNTDQGLIRKAATSLFDDQEPSFQNGNKRIAMTTLLVLLHKNRKWLRAPQDKLYTFSIQVAGSFPDKRETILAGIESFIRSHLISLPS